MRAISYVCLFFLAGCASPTAEQIETAISQATGDLRPIRGTNTAFFPVTIQLVEYGYSTPVPREVQMVHTVAGEYRSGFTIYRVGFVGGEPRIVLRGEMGNNNYQVVWESWPEGMRRAGNPPSQLIWIGE